jgi:hypothetical protein
MFNFKKNKNMNEKILPWDRQMDETDYHFKLFRWYLELGRNRTFVQISKIFSITTRTVSNYAKKWNWLQRVNLYEEYIFASNQSKNYEKLREMEKEKSALKVNYSILALDLAKAVQQYMNKWDSAYRHDDVKDKLKFLREVNLTMNLLLKTADNSMSSELSLNYFKDDVLVEKYIGQFNQQTSLENNNNINLIMNSISGMLSEKSQKQQEKEENYFEESSNSTEIMELQNA